MGLVTMAKKWVKKNLFYRGIEEAPKTPALVLALDEDKYNELTNFLAKEFGYEPGDLLVRITKL